MINPNLLDSISSIPEIDYANLVTPRNYLNADYQYEVICEHLKQFQDELDNEHEVGLQLASFGQTIL